ncbi:hypothetical protein PAB09_00185 [Corynebacterium sp. SCR221107]|uniref:hypothetical protein n=1 Tax=Corynebacterium sp. SCR221107 TaxID=3017361 RepID=UPI0022EC19FF|nr:hypothetical protein [Corynebacterium sp. SCR221107]WBT08821.1 hypothetical protein PAB09_00185 [Corynebacterium sp. SCR221107]
MANEMTADIDLNRLALEIDGLADEVCRLLAEEDRDLTWIDQLVAQRQALIAKREAYISELLASSGATAQGVEKQTGKRQPWTNWPKPNCD